jgi:hypothetical protein
MINHYRTLLLNQADQGNPDEYIAPNYTPLVLPPALLNFYNLIYPVGSTRFYGQFIEFYLESLLHATNQCQFLTSFDPRITYELPDLANYFAIDQISMPISSAFNYPLLVSGSYVVSPNINSYFEGFTISQVGSSSNILVYSNVSNTYLNGTLSSTIASSSMEIALTFSNGVSNIFPIGVSGVSARIAGDGTQFGSTSNKYWTFIAQAPLSFNFDNFYQLMKVTPSIVNTMMNYGPVDNTSNNLWYRHFNPLYQIAGLINSYVNKVNSVWET